MLAVWFIKALQLKAVAVQIVSAEWIFQISIRLNQINSIYQKFKPIILSRSLDFNGRKTGFSS
jgi:hypothetical protein